MLKVTYLKFENPGKVQEVGFVYTEDHDGMSAHFYFNATVSRDGGFYLAPSGKQTTRIPLEAVKGATEVFLYDVCAQFEKTYKDYGEQ